MQQQQQYAMQAPQPMQYAPPQQAMMLDVVVQYAYCGHRGKAYMPPDMHKAERRLRITVDETKTVSAIRDEVLQRKEIIPKPYQFLGSTTKTGSGFELDEKDLVRHVSHLSSASPLGRHARPTLTLPFPLCYRLPHAVSTCSSP